MSNQDDFNDRFNFTNSYFGSMINDPPVDNSKEIEKLSKKIDDLEKELRAHISGRYGVLYVPTHEELIKITTECIKDELRKINKPL